MNLELHLIDGGIDRGPLPSYLSASFSPVFCDIGGISFRYPKKGKKFAVMKGRDELEIVPWIDGVPQPRLGGYVNQVQQDDAADVSVVQYDGQSYMRRLEEIIVYPYGWPNYNTRNPSTLLSNQNPGQILTTLFGAATNRGTGTDITRGTFNGSTDSAGAAWAKMITLEVKPGATILDVMRSMYANNMIEFEMVGKDLRVYNYGTLGSDKTVVPAGTKPLTFRRGRDLLDSPRKLSSRDVNTVMLAAGKEDAGIYREKVNSTAVANRRRIEGFVSNGNLVDNGTLDAFTEAQLGRSVNPVMEKTHGLALANRKTPKPLVDFNVGDWAYSDSGEGLERLRIKSWVLTIDEKGFAKGSVSLNDLIAELNANLSKRIDGIIGGSTITGESKAVDAVPVDLTDGISPNTPVSLSLSSAPFTNNQGTTLAQVTATWPQVTQNTDGSPVTDLAGYNLQWRYANGPATAWYNVDSPGNGTTVSWSPVAPASAIEARIRTYDRAGNYSSWSGLYSVTTQDDTTPPEKPSTPVADNYLGLLRITFDGKTASGAAWAPDVNRWQVHASDVDGFTPSASTWVDTLTAAGSSFQDPGYGQTRYFRIVPMDRTGNLGTPSNQVSATSGQVVSDDVFDGAIGTEKLANLAVTTAKIANLAVNTAQIGSVDAGRITAGVMSAALTVSGRIATALVGKRVEMNGIGFQGFDAQNNNTLSLDGANNLMMGTFKTNLTGRRIEIAASGQRGELNFYGPSGQLGKFMGFTDDTSYFTNEALAMWYPISGKSVGWNSVNIASKEEAYVATGFIGMYCGGDGNGVKGFQVRWALDRGTATGLFNQGYVRLQIDSTTTIINDAWQNQKFAVTGTFVRIATHRSAVYNADGGGYINIGPAGDDATSALLTMFSGSGTFAGSMYFVNGEFRFVQNSAYTALRGSAFNVNSDEDSKTRVRKLTGSARDKLAPMQAHRYRVKDLPDKRDRVGFMAASAPDEIRVPDNVESGPGYEAIDLYGLTTLGIEYTREVDAELEALRAEVAELRELVRK